MNIIRFADRLASDGRDGAGGIGSIWFSLPNSGLGEHAVREICDILYPGNYAGSERFCTLELGNNQMSDASAELLGNTLLENDNITHLDLTGNNLQPEGIKILCDALRENQSIVEEKNHEQTSLTTNKSLNHKIRNKITK